MAETTTTTVQAPRDESTEVAQPSRRRGIIIVVVLILVLVGIGFWWHSTLVDDLTVAKLTPKAMSRQCHLAGVALNKCHDLGATGFASAVD